MKRSNKHLDTKLVLDTQTLRRLTERELSEARGGDGGSTNVGRSYTSLGGGCGSGACSDYYK